MADNVYLNNRLKYHTASRVAISTSQSMMQATNADGHTVTSVQVWSAPNKDFPKNTSAFAESSNVVGATNDLAQVFTNNFTTSEKITKTDYKNGSIWKNSDYPAVELYYQVEMSSVEYSDNQAWEIKDASGNRIMDWCSPTAVKNGVLPVPGYTGIAEATTTSGTTWTILQDSPNLSYGWSLAGGNWEFVYMSGMLTFHPDYIPSKMSFQRVRFTGFKYIGSTIGSDFASLETEISNLKTEVGTGVAEEINKTLAIKPYTFTLGAMTNVEGVYTINVPAFVIKVEDSFGIAIGNCLRKGNGTDVVFELTE